VTVNASDILKYGHQTVLRTIDGFPDSDWTTPGACGVWSVKDILAHLASYEHVLVDVLNTFLGGGPTLYLARWGEPGGGFNDAEVEARRAKTVAEVLAEFNDTHARTMELVARIAPETLREAGTLPWYGSEYALDDFIVYTYYGHKREHAAQIAAFRDLLNR
jgi:uncharacterized protein (TIGR03083 family)